MCPDQFPYIYFKIMFLSCGKFKIYGLQHQEFPTLYILKLPRLGNITLK